MELPVDFKPKLWTYSRYMGLVYVKPGQNSNLCETVAFNNRLIPLFRKPF